LKKKKIKTIFDGTNAEVVEAFESMLEDVKAIMSDEEYPSFFIAGVDENAPKAELGKAYVREKAGQKMGQFLQVFLRKKPDNIFNILDVLFCVEKGTYRNKSFKQTMDDLRSIDVKDLGDMLNFIFATISAMK
jgi:hypothetical protein